MPRLKKRADGRAVVTKVYDGKRKYFYGKTQAEANRKMAEFEEAQKKQVYNSDILYTEWLDAWLDERKHVVAPNTFANYKVVAEKHLRPLGTYKLAELVTPIIRQYLNEKTDAGLSPRSVGYIYTLLKHSLKLAVNDRLIAFNPMDEISKPKLVKVRQQVALSHTQVQKLLSVITNKEDYNIFYLALATGLRRSELLGLNIPDVNFRYLGKKVLTVESTVIKDGTKIRLSNTTKNKSSKRMLSIDNATLAVIKSQRLIVLQRKFADPQYIDNNLLFPGTHGQPRNPDDLSRLAKKYKEIADLPEAFTFHSLRHPYVKLKLKNNSNFFKPSALIH